MINKMKHDPPLRKISTTVKKVQKPSEKKTIKKVIQPPKMGGDKDDK